MNGSGLFGCGKSCGAGEAAWVDQRERDAAQVGVVARDMGDVSPSDGIPMAGGAAGRQRRMERAETACVCRVPPRLHGFTGYIPTSHVAPRRRGNHQREPHTSWANRGPGGSVRAGTEAFVSSSH